MQISNAQIENNILINSLYAITLKTVFFISISMYILYIYSIFNYLLTTTARGLSGCACCFFSFSFNPRYMHGPRQSVFFVALIEPKSSEK